jgi:hypothetical protein
MGRARVGGDVIFLYASVLALDCKFKRDVVTCRNQRKKLNMLRIAPTYLRARHVTGIEDFR